MPLPLAHALVGAAVAHAVLLPESPRRNAKLTLAAAASVLPDLDFIPVFFFGITRDVHRGFTHSLGFAAILACIAWLAAHRHKREALAAVFAIASHGLLDALTTTSGRGVALLWPFSELRWKLAVVEFSDLHPQWAPADSALHVLVVSILQAVPVAIAIMSLMWMHYRWKARIQYRASEQQNSSAG